jgi:hypothetical protein
MSERTMSSMHDARDAEDERLLEAGDHAALLRSYFETVILRCRTEDDSTGTARCLSRTS